MQTPNPHFQPIGREARWKTIYNRLKTLSPGDVLTYDTMAELLGLDAATHRNAIQMAFQRAQKELLVENQRACETVRGVGYRVAEPVKHVALARQRNVRAHRQIKRGYEIATNVDLTGVDPNVRSALEQLAMGFARQGEINRRLARKADEANKGVELLQRQQGEVQNRLAELERRLAERDGQ